MTFDTIEQLILWANHNNCGIVGTLLYKRNQAEPVILGYITPTKHNKIYVSFTAFTKSLPARQAAEYMNALGDALESINNKLLAG